MFKNLSLVYCLLVLIIIVVASLNFRKESFENEEINPAQIYYKNQCPCDFMAEEYPEELPNFMPKMDGRCFCSCSKETQACPTKKVEEKKDSSANNVISLEDKLPTESRRIPYYPWYLDEPIELDHSPLGDCK